MLKRIVNLFSCGYIGDEVKAGQKWKLDGYDILSDCSIVEKVVGGMVYY